MPPPPTAAEWEEQRPLITDLYVEQKMKLDDIVKLMEERNFPATKFMLQKRIIKWGISKKMSVADALGVVQAIERRARAGRTVRSIGIRGHEVTVQEARLSLKRRKRDLRSPLQAICGPSTPSHISIVCEDDGEAGNAACAYDDELGHLLANAVVRQRPQAPSLATTEEIEYFFIQKLHDWRSGSPARPATDIGPLFAQLEELQRVIYHNRRAANRRCLLAKRAIVSELKRQFQIFGYWLIPTLVQAACALRRTAFRRRRLLQAVHSDVFCAARTVVGDTTQHPLLVFCVFIFGGMRERVLGQLLRHCSVFAQRSFGSWSGEHQYVDHGRATYLSRRVDQHPAAADELQEAESILTTMIDALSHGAPSQEQLVLTYKCDLSRVCILQRKRDQAEATVLEVLASCHEAPREQHVPLHKLQGPLPYAYRIACGLMAQLSWDKGEPVAAEAWAWEAVQHSLQAFGPYGSRTVTAVQNLASYLTAQGKQTEADALLRDWHDVIYPPDLVAEVGEEGQAWSEGEDSGDYTSSDDEMADGDDSKMSDGFQTMEEGHGVFEPQPGWQ